MKKTKFNRKTKKKLNNYKFKKMNKYSEENIVLIFLEMLNTIKLYHWKTYSYAQHKSTDKLYGELSDNIDLFVEIMLGKENNRVNLINTKYIPLFDFNSSADFLKKIDEYKLFLINMNKELNIKNNSDLLNVRDEILGNIDQFEYLFTFN